MLLRSLSGVSLFLFATAFTLSASAQTPPPTVPPDELSAPPAPAPAPAVDAAVIVEVDSADAKVLLDGQPVEGALSGKRTSVPPGHHVVEASLAGRPPIHREMDVGAGGTVGVVLRMIPLSTDAIGYDEPQESSGPSHTDRPAPRLPLVLTGAALAVVALGFGIGLNRAANGEAHEAAAEQVVIGQAGGTTSSCNTSVGRFAAACTTLREELGARDHNADVAVAAYAVAGVAAAATIAYVVWPFFTEGHGKCTASLWAAPIIGTSTGGFAVAGVF